MHRRTHPPKGGPGGAGEFRQADGSVHGLVLGSRELAPHGRTAGVVDFQVEARRIVLDLRQQVRIGADAPVVAVLADVEEDGLRTVLTREPGVDLGADSLVDPVVGQPEAQGAARDVDVDVRRADGAVRAGLGTDLVPAHVDEVLRPLGPVLGPAGIGAVVVVIAAGAVPAGAVVAAPVVVAVRVPVVVPVVPVTAVVPVAVPLVAVLGGLPVVPVRVVALLLLVGPLTVPVVGVLGLLVGGLLGVRRLLVVVALLWWVALLRLVAVLIAFLIGLLLGRGLLVGTLLVVVGLLAVGLLVVGLLVVVVLALLRGRRRDAGVRLRLMRGVALAEGEGRSAGDEQCTNERRGDRGPSAPDHRIPFSHWGLSEKLVLGLITAT